MDRYIIFIILIIIIVMVIWAFWILSGVGYEFYRMCDELEWRIRNEDDLHGQLEGLYNLRGKSFHRKTGDRVRELALMMEMKYGIKILKK